MMTRAPKGIQGPAVEEKPITLHRSKGGSRQYWTESTHAQRSPTFSPSTRKSYYTSSASSSSST